MRNVDIILQRFKVGSFKSVRISPWQRTQWKVMRMIYSALPMQKRCRDILSSLWVCGNYGLYGNLNNTIRVGDGRRSCKYNSHSTFHGVPCGAFNDSLYNTVVLLIQTVVHSVFL